MAEGKSTPSTEAGKRIPKEREPRRERKGLGSAKVLQVAKQIVNPRGNRKGR